ncbi:hypothetical protein [Arcobacter sp. LA11]|uniref:hypothetical protein n=1 Tax=Arcobacter sp. LA11 TaxID=1898176 RepID=UPI000934E1AB|nr:hypothetical protein [Arcobacter sp. LA11]
MKIFIMTLFLFIVFQGCSFKSPQNQWEFNSSNSFNSYARYFLIDEEDLAQSDLQRAIKYAKQSANLEQLGRVYLGACALNKSVEQNNMCKNYIKIEEFIVSKELKIYFSMLVSEVKEEQIKYLPKQYRTFVNYKSLKKYDLAFESIKSMEQSSSKFIAASLIKDKLKKEQIKYLVEESSFLGYKKIVLFWLEYYYEIEEDLSEKEKIAKKIKILKI